MMLPNGYIPCISIMPLNNAYIDTGILPKNTLSVDTLISGAGYYNATGYAFGGRNTASTSSAGQLGYFFDTTSTNYFAYASARVSLGNGDGLTNNLNRMIHFYNNSNECEVIGQLGLVLTATGATSSFTGTKSIFIFGMNNAGTLSSWARISLHGFTIKDSGTAVFDGEPSYEESSGKYGLYDHVSGSFFPLSSARSMFLVEFDQSDGGQSYGRTFQRDYVKKVYGGEHINEGYDLVQCVAVPEDGFSFYNWTDSNGNIVSTEKEFIYSATANTTLKANFIKDVNKKTKVGYKARFLKYGAFYETASVMPSLRNDTFANILSGSVTVDSLQRATSTFTVDELPSTVQPFCPVFITSPKGESVYQGIVWSIDGNSITCREPTAIWDEDYIFKPSTNGVNGRDLTKYTVIRSLRLYLFYMEFFVGDGLPEYEYFGYRKHQMVQPESEHILNLKEEDNLTATTPLTTEINVQNMEDYLFSMFKMGIYVRAELKEDTTILTYTRHYMSVIPFYYKNYDTILLSDNQENIRNLSVVNEEMETTVMILMNSAGTTIRGFYSLDNSDTVIKYDTLTEADRINLIGYNNYKKKIVLSDDKVKTEAAQNLTSSKLGHKITFDYDGKFGSIQIGHPVNFYHGDRMYQSIVTGLKFDIDSNDDEIRTMQVTLGNVRTSLTSKLNLDKLGKK